jgi:VWFA-related protein
MGHRQTIFFIGLLLIIGGSMLTASGQSPALDPDETIRIETDLVDLNVSVLSRNPARPPGNLTQKDFAVFENGAAQKIAFFASAETPFDLVLLLDLSGSTSSKLDLIKKSAQRFVDAVPATDRVAIVTFTKEPRVETPLTLDRQDLEKAINAIKKPNGGTNFWDALRFVLESVLSQNLPRSQRRAAVVAMTDGVDNALPDVVGEGSQTTFEQLIKVLHSSEAIVLPVYLDTEAEEVKRKRIPASAYVLARQQLATLADEVGSIVYHARELKDLDTVYQQVIRDLGTVYSVGYRPTNKTRDGSWRAISVRVPSRPELAVRARRGYFAR